ncbi:MAG: methyltransferase domain-containing protein [Lentisphaerae bacterium]|nr:methyltransferase domain-containing protein [Lentisphaerota bacterium]
MSAPRDVLPCRFCATPLEHTFVDLGMSPLCQRHVTPEQRQHMEPFYPLHAYVCHSCFLVQLPPTVAPQEIFSDYAYFSSYVGTLLRNAQDYVNMAVKRFGLTEDSWVVELASNDGYLLQYFIEQGIPVLGVEPAENVAEVAIEKGVPMHVAFFGTETAEALVAERGQADLVLGNNVLAHVPDLNDFVEGMHVLLSPGGTITMEFPHLCQLMEHNQFDTIYQEHYSYYSFTTVEGVFAAHGITLFDVDETPIHGGSLRIYGRHADNNAYPVTDRVHDLKAREEAMGVTTLDFYFAFAEKVKETKRQFLEFLIEAKRAGKTICGYGAPGKSATLLNYCGVGTDFIDYTVDRNPYKQGNFTPGTHIPILAPEQLAETQPDYLVILPWNLVDEISEQTSYIREWGGKWVVPIPACRVIE